MFGHPASVVVLGAWLDVHRHRARLSGAQHSFDHFRSLRARVVVDRIEAFAAWPRSTERRVPAG